MQPKPIIHVYAVCKNEIEFLPFITSYYKNIADKIIIYDNQSVDGSKEYIASHPLCTLKEYNTKNELRDDIHMFIKNSVWKDSIGVADWVIVADLDELIYHKSLIKELQLYKKLGVTIPTVEGFNMISKTYPVKGESIIKQVKYGAYSRQYSKNIIFDPNKITEINFTAGGHSIEPVGDVKFGGYLKLLHYKYLGTDDRMLTRWNEVGKTLSNINIKNNWGIERTKPEIIIHRINTVFKNKELVIDNSPWGWKSKITNLFKKRDLTVPF